MQMDQSYEAQTSKLMTHQLFHTKLQANLQSDKLQQVMEFWTKTWRGKGLGICNVHYKSERRWQSSIVAWSVMAR
jgi:hypothetical protein